MPRFELRRLVAEDLQVLTEAFEPVDIDGNGVDVEGAISFPYPFEEGVNAQQEVREPTAVWTFTGRHVGPLLGFEPTDAIVTVTGVTIFRMPEYTDSGEIECHRSIDWLDVLNQIGVTLHHRTIPEVLD